MEAFRAAREELVRGERVALATVLATRGSTPREPGAHMAVRRDRSIAGTVGGGQGEADVIAAAMDVIEGGRSRLLPLEMWAEGGETGEGMVCGGSMQILIEPLTADRDLPWLDRLLRITGEAKEAFLVRELDERSGEAILLHVLGEGEEAPGVPPLPPFFEEEARRIRSVDTLSIERVPPRDQLLVFGAGHVGVSLCEVASLLDFDVHVFDDRGEFATPDRFPRAFQVHSAPWASMLAEIPAGERVYAVLVAHGYSVDVMVLEKMLRREYAYVGVIGSRRRATTVRRLLVEKGFASDDLARLYSPIGIDIGAQTPAEIAISIAGELVAVRNGRVPPPSSLSRE